MNDLRHAFRTLRRSPGFAIVAGIALALGIGANAAVFSVINAVLLRPLPYPDGDAVVRVYSRWEGTPQGGISPAEHFDYLDRTSDVFEQYGVYGTGSVNLAADDGAERVPAAFLSAGVLPALGIQPAGGRVFAAEADVPGGSPVVVVSDALARRRFGTIDVVGSELVVNGNAVTVIGVMPPSFRLPTDFIGTVTEVMVPLRLDRANVTARGSHFLVGVARLRDDVSVVRAAARLDDITATMVATYPDDYPRDMRFGAWPISVINDVAGDVQPILLILLGAVGLVLLVACANVASLTLTRADARRREFAVRTALGARPAHLIRQLFCESLVLAALGGSAGVLMATWGVSGLLALQPLAVPRADAIGLDARVLLFASGVTLLTALLFGFAPLVNAKRDPSGVLREDGRAGTSARRLRFRHALVTLEIALAVVLLSGAGLLVRSLVALLAVDPGYHVGNVLTTRITLPGAVYADDVSRRDFFTELERRAAALPGVIDAGAVTNLPLANPLGDINISIEGRIPAQGEVSPALDWQAVTPGYFHAIGMTLSQGRPITDADHENAPGVVVINETAARTLFANQDAIGQRFTLGGGAGPGMVTVIGIIDDVRHNALGLPPRPAMYLAHRQFRFWNGGAAANTLTLVLHTSGAPEAFATPVRVLLAQLDPDLPPGPFLTMQNVRNTAVAQPRFVTSLLLAFGAMALLLAVVGVFGLISYSVGLRRHEFGVRVALGAGYREILRLVLNNAILTIGAGLAAGLLVALAATRVISELLFGVRPGDPVTMLSVIAILAITSFAACIVPACRAARADPIRALRSD